MRRLAAVTLMLAACAQPGVPISGESRNVGSITVTLKVEPSRVRSGQPVGFTLSLQNNSGRAQTLRFPSGQKYDFAVSRNGRQVWRWSQDRVFPQALAIEELPGQSGVRYSEAWTSSEAGLFEVTARLKAEGFQKPLTGTVRIQ